MQQINWRLPTMKQFFTVVSLVAAVAIATSLFSSQAPAASNIAPAALQKSIKQVPQPQVVPDEQYSQLFCIKRQDMVDVRTAYVVGGDALARNVADNLVNKNSCGYRATVFNSHDSVVPCENQANGYCIAVQPVFTCKGDVVSCAVSDAIPGFDLEASNPTSGNVLPNTEAMAPVRTIIYSHSN